MLGIKMWYDMSRANPYFYKQRGNNVKQDKRFKNNTFQEYKY